ncbi:thioredoxin family protein [Candidatus Dependentiae bacterium]
MTKRSRLLLLAGLITITCFNTSLGKIIKVESKKHLANILAKNKHVLLKFYADWCSICNAIKEPFKKVADKKEFAHIAFVEVDITKNPVLAAKYQARSIPKFVYIKNNRNIYQELGARNIATFENYLTDKLKEVFTAKKSVLAQPKTKTKETQKSVWGKTKQLFVDMYAETKHLLTSSFKK